METIQAPRFYKCLFYAASGDFSRKMFYKNASPKQSNRINL
nr:MAG TPA: hypothetical protein [Caudoviricetes sp.]